MKEKDNMATRRKEQADRNKMEKETPPYDFLIQLTPLQRKSLQEALAAKLIAFRSQLRMSHEEFADIARMQYPGQVIRIEQCEARFSWQTLAPCARGLAYCQRPSESKRNASLNLLIDLCAMAGIAPPDEHGEVVG